MCFSVNCLNTFYFLKQVGKRLNFPQSNKLFLQARFGISVQSRFSIHSTKKYQRKLNYFKVYPIINQPSKLWITTQLIPNPFHRVYRPERQPPEGNKWVERLILLICLALGLTPTLYLIKYYDGQTPITHRKRILFVPLWMDEMIGVYTLQALQLTDAETEEGKKDSVEVQYIQDIFYHILKSNHLLLKTDISLIAVQTEMIKEKDESTSNVRSDLKKFQDFEWNISIVNNTSVINAMCVPGGKMIIYTGILKQVIANDDECAALICHEIAHALCRHGVESVQFSLFIVACVYLTASLFSGIDFSWMTDKLIMFAINVILKLPMSRRAEIEADEIAIYLMNESGYRLQALIDMLTKLGKVEDRLGHFPEFLSTHPLTKNRIEILQEKINSFEEKQNFTV